MSVGARAVSWRDRPLLSAPALLLAGALAAVGVLLLALAPGELHSDTWIALVAGREVAHGGIPGHETLTIAAHGRHWIDQQWLAQLSMYELERIGGIALVGFVSVALVFGAVVGAVLAARRLGARLLSIALILPLAVFGLGQGLEVRTEAYAYPLLVALVYLLADDARRPGAKVWWCLALLALWGNLHGSAIMAAGLVSLRGVTVGWERRRSLVSSARAWAKPLGLLLGGPLCLIANPYGPSIASYYRATLFNGQLRHLTSEWQPVTHDPVMTVALALLVLVALWSLVRHRRQSVPWDRLALLTLAVGGVVAVRNLPWFALASLVLLPVWLDPGVRAPVWRGRAPVVIGAAVAAFGAVWVVQGSVSLFTESRVSWGPSYPADATGVLRAELGPRPTWRVWGDDAYADWMLWELPSLRGRVAADARFELLSDRQLAAEVDLVFAEGAQWKRAARGCRLIVFDGPGYPRALAGFEHEPGARTIYDHAGLVMIVRSAAAAAA